MSLTTQAIPEYVYLEVADILAEHVKHGTEDTIAKNNIQLGGCVTVGMTFTLELPLLEPGTQREPTVVDFKVIS